MDELDEYLIKEILEVPQSWGKGGRVHNWRNHVGYKTREIWDTFTEAQKLAIGVDAVDRANNENWE